MEIKELNYLLTKKMQRNFICAIMLLVTVTSAINARWKDQLSENKARDYTPFLSRPELHRNGKSKPRSRVC